MNAHEIAEITAVVISVLDEREKAAQAPAKKAPAKRRTRKAAPKKAAPKRTEQPKADLGRKGWNRALTASARAAGKCDCGASVYAAVLANWDAAQAMRDAGLSPAQALMDLRDVHEH